MARKCAHTDTRHGRHTRFHPGKLIVLLSLTIRLARQTEFRREPSLKVLKTFRCPSVLWAGEWGDKRRDRSWVFPSLQVWDCRDHEHGEWTQHSRPRPHWNHRGGRRSRPLALPADAGSSGEDRRGLTPEGPPGTARLPAHTHTHSHLGGRHGTHTQSTGGRRGGGSRARGAGPRVGFSPAAGAMHETSAAGDRGKPYWGPPSHNRSYTTFPNAGQRGSRGSVRDQPLPCLRRCNSTVQMPTLRLGTLRPRASAQLVTQLVCAQ